MSTENINGYALALLSLAKEENKLEKIKKDASIIIEALEENNEYVNIISSKSIENDVKQDMVSKAFKGINKNIINFLHICSERNIASIVIPVLKKLIKLMNEELNIKEGIVYSVEKLSRKEISDIELRVEKKLGFKPSLSNKLDIELISGIKVVVGDEVIEDTVLSRLSQLKNELLGEEK